MYALKPGKLGLVTMVVAAVYIDKLVEALQRGEAHSRGYLIHLAVGAYVDDIIVPCEAEVLHQAYFVSKLSIVCDDGSAFQGVETLGGVKTEDFSSAKSPYHFSLVRTAEGMGSIVQHLEAMTEGYLIDCFHITGFTPYMNPHDACGPWRD